MRNIHSVAVLALLGGLTLALAPAASAQLAVGIAVRIGPPQLRVLAVQPMCPGPGYFWTPGYWAYNPAGYYWVSGAWVLAPAPGLLWTPGYWGYAGGAYVWRAGYWGPHVGFYGGVNYGFGYFGTGFAGGRWAGGRFYYNTAVWRVNRTVIRNTYVDRTVIRNVHVNRISYNGGPGGINARPSAEEARYAQERHMRATPVQMRRANRTRTMAGRNRGPRNQNQAVRRTQQRRPPAAHAQKQRVSGKAKPKRDKHDKNKKSGPGGF
ncbi:MAG: YXWGXW repeat-containing protein [Terriglobales bacterium]